MMMRCWWIWRGLELELLVVDGGSCDRIEMEMEMEPRGGGYEVEIPRRHWRIGDSSITRIILWDEAVGKVRVDGQIEPGLGGRCHAKIYKEPAAVVRACRFGLKAAR